MHYSLGLIIWIAFLLGISALIMASLAAGPSDA